MLKVFNYNVYDIELPPEDEEALKKGCEVLCDIYSTMKKYECDILRLKDYEDESFMKITELMSLVQGMENLTNHDIVGMTG